MSHSKINYRLCTAVDLTKLGILLDELKTLGMTNQEAKTLDQQARVLLATLRTANNRLHGIETVESP